MRPVRASEIGSFLFCRRAWWFRGQGVEAENQEALVEGSLFHRRHGFKVIATGFLRLAAWGLLLAAVVLLAVAITLIGLH